MIAKILSINRLRMGIDGPGITTLIGLYKCPLNCEYCINNPILNYAEFTIENKLGQLSNVYLANFFIIENDLFEIEPKQLKDIKVLETYVCGKKVF